MEKYLRNIDAQINSNRGKNLFHKEPELKFIKETENLISEIRDIPSETEKILIEYLCTKTLEEFCRVNQYYSFHSEARQELKMIYAELFANIRSDAETTEDIPGKHYNRIKKWLEKNNAFATRIYSPDIKKIDAVTCAEYSPDLQLDVLMINVSEISEPLLDIGCGSEGRLVKFLNNRGIMAFGIDRFSFSEENFATADWLEYNYGVEKWGTIVSHLGFSNHFRHHHLREDGNYLGYGRKYMEILESLKKGGQFHYSPSLEFIEQFLDKNIYSVSNYLIGNNDFKTTLIKKL